MNTMVYRCVSCQTISAAFGLTCPRCGRMSTMRRTGMETFPLLREHKTRCPKCSSTNYNAAGRHCKNCNYTAL